MVERDTQGKLVITFSFIGFIVMIAGAIGTVIYGIIMATSSYNTLMETQANQKIDLGRVWAEIEKVQRTEADLQKEIDTGRLTIMDRDAATTQLISEQRSRLDQLSENIRNVQTETNSMVAGLSTTLHDEGAKADKIIEEISNLKASLARVETRLGKVDEPNHPLSGRI